ncbi:hypothetical protein LB503_006402, partial [Fusarium chuoi]
SATSRRGRSQAQHHRLQHAGVPSINRPASIRSLGAKRGLAIPGSLYPLEPSQGRFPRPRHRHSRFHRLLRIRILLPRGRAPPRRGAWRRAPL